MTELSEKLRREIEDGKSLREIGRKAGMSATTVRKALLGKELDRSTIDRLARYFHLPVEEVYRLAGILPSMYTHGHISRDFLLAKLWDVICRLPEADQALVLAEAIRLLDKYPPPDEQTKD